MTHLTHLMSLKEPSCDYNTVANRGLRKAGLPEVTLEHDGDSTNILRVLAPKDNANIIKAPSQESVQSHIQAIERQDMLLNEPEEGEMQDAEELQITIPAKDPQPVSFIPPESPTYLAEKRARNQPSTSSQADIKRLADGTPYDPRELGLSLHDYDPNKHRNLNRKSIGEEIHKGTIKYTYNNPLYQSPEIEIKNFKHLKAGALEINAAMIQEKKDIKTIRNGFEEHRDKPIDKKKPTQ